MRFVWTRETAFPGWSLRDSNGLARSIVTGPNVHRFYFGQIFTRGMPTSDPFFSPQEAAAWVTAELIMHELVPAGSTFGDIDAAEAA